MEQRNTTPAPRRIAATLAWALVLLLGLLLPCHPAGAREKEDARHVGGELRFRADGEERVQRAPLRRTDVQGGITGFFGRVSVRQVFENPTDRKIEAVYVFPLPENAAVDRMVMTVGDRRVVGVVKERQEARRVYDQAKREGKVASLLDQERPNVFTQSVANILPGARVVIEISYVQTLAFEDGVFEFVFPMTVGPRYVPAGSVPDAERLSPAYAPPDTRAGHDIGLTLHLDTAGLPLRDMVGVQHGVAVTQEAPDRAVVRLATGRTIPNRDFVLRYRVAPQGIGDALLTHSRPGARGGRFFTLLLQPPKVIRPADAVPKEMVFVIDRSGSMSGFPIEKAKEAMRRCILSMNPRDTFNLISFAGGTGKCFPRPVANTRPNRTKALRYLEDLYGEGGTELMPAVLEALGGEPAAGRMRVACFMTDGYIGDDFEIIGAVKKYANTARVFCFGIGPSVNRFLLDGMAREGRGEVEYVTLEESADRAVSRFVKRVQAPLLADISLDWGSLPVYDVYPARIPDLFGSKPVLVHGRVRGEKAVSGRIVLKGRAANGAFRRELRLDLPAASTDEDGNDAVASLWARAKVDHLTAGDLPGVQRGTLDERVKREIIDLGVQFGLMTQFTSFVAVEDYSNTGAEPAETVGVPAELPEGMSPEFATSSAIGYGLSANASGATPPPSAPQFYAQAGDPLIRIEAPADTLSVVALLPGGEAKPLTQDPVTGHWEAHFDIPTYAESGNYDVTVILVGAGGARRSLTLRYRVDAEGPAGAGAVRAVAGGAAWSLEVEADGETARVVAMLPWGARTVLERTRAAQGAAFRAQAPVPTPWRGREGAVTFVLTDRAHNRTTVTVDMTAP